MKINQNVHQRIKALKINLNEIRRAYEELTRDYILDSGIEYEKQYPDNAETHTLFKKADNLHQLRKDALFTAVLNFSQTFYSIKEYLLKQSPTNKIEIENFFSNEIQESISRKSISNDLKHNPNEDLKFATRVVKTETSKEPGKENHISYMRQSWFYGKLETVEFCQKLYEELIVFMHKQFK